MLVAQGLVYKRRGLGMFVSEEAPALLRSQYREQFAAQQIEPLVHRARALGLGSKELITMITTAREGQR
jgi:DNA-binding transcriptional regulator YhcF (GntR family)